MLIPLLLLGVAGAAAYLYSQAAPAGNVLEQGEDEVQAAVSGWANVNEGPTWVPVLNAAETAAGIPTNLLARQAFAESGFRAAVIDGTQPSSAGALGIMQLMPQYFQSVQVPVPFTSADTSAQITEAAGQMASLYQQFNDWALALAAYNDGASNVQSYLAGARALPQATVDYVSAILADVPVASSAVVA